MNVRIEDIGFQVDTAADDGNFEKLWDLSECCKNEVRNADATDKVILRFYEANCYSAIARIRKSNRDLLWSWNEDERVLEILALRQAISDRAFDDLDPVIQCKIFTNLGNSLNHLGRPIEAIRHWNKTLETIPNFAMALGNKGKGLLYYGQSLYDHGHTNVFTACAKDELGKAISEEALWESGPQPEIREQIMQDYIESIEYLRTIKYDFEFDLDQWPLGSSEDEVNYRGWCLHHRLFLSPLNDVIRFTVAAQDVIHLPNHTYKIEEKPRFPNYYNLLKQEYVAARYMLYQAMNEKENVHISDNDVLLLDGFDGVQYGYRTEQLKTAYRLAYSLFDKVALFINDYFSVGMKVEAVSFRTIWGKRKATGVELYSCFSDSKNWPLRGLYYLSKDLYDDRFKDVSLPEARELASLRHRTEHRFLSIQEYPATVQNTDTHSYMAISDFEDKALRILSIAREALIYLSLTMHREETLLTRSDDDGKLSVPLPSVPIEKL